MPNRALTGIQATGKPHLGNIIGALKPITTPSRAEDPTLQRFVFIADLHALTKTPSQEELKSNTQTVAAAWATFVLSRTRRNMGGKTAEVYFYRQSRIPEICELYWYLSCLMPKSRLELGHAFKATDENKVNAGLFSYPILMAADILLFSVGVDDLVVPVGKDQRQHLEVARDLAKRFNHRYGQLLREPESRISPTLLPGTDGKKMSKSKGNTLDVLGDKEALRKAVFRIQTDSQPIPTSPTDADSNRFRQSTVYQIYKAAKPVIDSFLLQDPPKIDLDEKLEDEEEAYGYGRAKDDLNILLRDGFEIMRNLYQEFKNDPKLVEDLLVNGTNEAVKKRLKEKNLDVEECMPEVYGEEKVRKIAEANMKEIRKAIGIGGE